jgi:hypothetical protein
MVTTREGHALPTHMALGTELLHLGQGHSELINVTTCNTVSLMVSHSNFLLLLFTLWAYLDQKKEKFLKKNSRSGQPNEF